MVYVVWLSERVIARVLKSIWVSFAVDEIH